MAIADKDILITPNRSGILGNQPNVVFTGADSSIGDSAAITVTANPENSGTLNFSASEGQLFSISNNLTDGDIFTVNDVSGIPSLAIGANGIVKIAEYSGRILLGGATDDSASLLQVNGHIQLSDFDATGSVGALKFGNDSSLKIYKLASNNNAVISNNHSTGDLLYLSHLHSFRNAGNTEVMANFIENGAVELNFNNNKSFETRNLGFMYEDSDVIVDVGNQSNFGVIELGGSAGAFIDMKTPKGEDYDFRMQLTSGNTALIQSDDLHIQSKTGAENYLDATVNGAVNLYYDNVKKLETTAYGATVTGTINADSATFSGDVIFDSAGCIFFDKSEKALRVAFGKEVRFADRGQAVFGSDKDLTIEHFSSFSGSIMENRTGFFKIYSHSGFNFKDSAVGHSFLTYIPSLNHRVLIAGADANGQSVTRINTVDSGVNITGNLRVNNQEFSSGASAGFAIAMAIAL